MTPEPGTDEVDEGPLERSRQVVDEGHEAARDALESDPLGGDLEVGDDVEGGGDLEVPGIGTDAEGDGEEVTPRPT